MKSNPFADSPGWYSRGYLQHFDLTGVIQSVSIRLCDAVPEHVIDQWKAELLWSDKMPKSDPRRRVLRKSIEKYVASRRLFCEGPI